MVGWHKETIDEIARELDARYCVKKSYKLPQHTRDGVLLLPDIVALDRKTKDIKHIVEVQT